MTLARSAPLRSRRTAPRTWRCKHCQARNPGDIKRCPACKIGRGTKRTSLKARCDTLARTLCKLLARGLCRRCGKPGSDWAHRMPRRHHSMRWSMDNCDFLCRECHDWFGRHPMAFTAWLIEQVGTEKVTEIETKANDPWNRDYSAVIADLERQLREVKG